MHSSLHSNTVPLRTLTRQLYIGNICTLPCRAPGTAFLLPLLPWRCSPGDGELALQLYVPDPRDHEERRVARLEELEDGPPFCSAASPPSSRKQKHAAAAALPATKAAPPPAFAIPDEPDPAEDNLLAEFFGLKAEKVIEIYSGGAEYVPSVL